MTNKKSLTVSQDDLDTLIERKLYEREHPPVHPVEHCLGCYVLTDSRAADMSPFCIQCIQDGYGGNPQWAFITWRKMGAKKGQSFPVDLHLRLCQIKKCTPRELYELDVEELASLFDQLMVMTDENHHRPFTPSEQEANRRTQSERVVRDKVRALKSKINAAEQTIKDQQSRLEGFSQELEDSYTEATANGYEL